MSLIAVEIDATTGESVERALTTDELAQRAADEAAFATIEAERAQAQADRAAARESAIARFKALGFSDDEIATLVLP